MSEPPAALHTLIRRLVFAIALAFGLPSRMARSLPRGAARLLRQALTMLETLVRAMLLVAARALPECKSRLRRAVKIGARDWGRGGFANDDSAAWGVTFHLATARPGRRRPRLRLRPRGARAFSAWPLAERFEAVLRVLENPQPFVRRAAIWLRRQSVPRTPQGGDPGSRADAQPVDLPGSRLRLARGAAFSRPDDS